MDINATLIGQMITFGIFVWFTMKFVWPMLDSALTERKQKISSGLAAAEKGQHTLKQAEQKVVAELKAARIKSSEIISEANKQAAMLIEEAQNEAHKEKLDILSAGHKQIEQEFNRIKKELKDEMADLIVAGAEKILEKTIKAEDHKDILDKIVAKM